MASDSHTLLRTTETLLRLLRALNIAAALLILGCLLASLVAPEPFLSALAGEVPAGEEPIYFRMIRFALLLSCLIAFPVHLIFTHLLHLVGSARREDPFELASARRLRLIAWMFLTVQVADIAYGYLAIRFSMATDEYAGWSPNLSGWLAVLLLFVLARIFEQGARMREELAGTV